MEILEDRSIIRVAGSDAARFLQALITNDIEKLNNLNHPPLNSAIYTYFLNGQGRFLFDAFILKEDGSNYLLDVNKEYSQKLLTRLEFLKINMNIEILLEEKWQICYSRSKPVKKIVYKDNRYEKMGYRAIVEKYDYHEDKSIEAFIYLEDKYKYSIPDGVIDLLYEKSIPLEYGAQSLSSIGYNKGCYTGQEIITRTLHQGEIRKYIYQLIFDQLVDFHNGEDVMQEGQKVGKICSSWQNYAISIIKPSTLIQDSSAFCNNFKCTLKMAEFYKKLITHISSKKAWLRKNT
ncbi:MAG: hypothetical protein EB127_09825 [Alphaproteobacteria bacterium]|nr:hypothetical protein [Alphaproteobacteria bacterium]